ncbi:MAG: CBS domain-containing protein [Kastovskya adunca ATA6-11-RM4]|nr:CBS domain-containing protein [Kastovskya adunca ATA6-11-RM4]
MDVILCHTTADFDTLGAAIGLTRLRSGARVVLTGGAHPTVRDFLALHRDEYPLIERRSVRSEEIRSLIVVDTQSRDRIGKAAEWVDLPNLKSLEIYDHHLDIQSDIPATHIQIEPVGATTTLIVEQLQQNSIQLTTAESTVMALGIHVDTGSLTYEQTTPRDALALAWLMTQGAKLRLIFEYVDPGLSPQLQSLLTEALKNLQTETHQGYTLSWVILKTAHHVPGLSSLASQLMEITESDALLLAAEYGGGAGEQGSRGAGEQQTYDSNSGLRTQDSGLRTQKPTQDSSKLAIIGRSRIDGTNLNELFQELGGGGHSQAASATLRSVKAQEVLEQLIPQLKEQIPQVTVARELMSSPVRTIRPDTTIGEAQRILLRYGHSGLSVVDKEDKLVGVISRRDIDLALHHGFSHAPVKGYMTTQLHTITPETPLPEIESLMVTYDIGRLPVLEDGQLVGIVTRTDVLRQLHQQSQPEGKTSLSHSTTRLTRTSIREELQKRLTPRLWDFLSTAAQAAQERGWHLYLVGGAVRDLLLAAPDDALQLQDIDMVVDGFHRAADVGAGVALAQALQESYPNARLEVHGEFQTAALLWHKDPVLGSLWVDIATARTEFYPYPAANPEVEASSIRQDLYRRDFTINALAVRLTAPRSGELLDFFGGLSDLRSRRIRVLHANSFIEDPTRIYRAVRFAVRLGFQIDPQSAASIHYAIESGVYERSLSTNSKAPALQTRLKAELKYLLQAPYWVSALQLLGSLNALKCLHPALQLDKQLWWQVRLVDRWLRRFDSNQTLIHWQMRLEVLIAHLAPEYRAVVANQLQLPADSIERLEHLAEDRALVIQELPQCEHPSQGFELLRAYKLPSLVLIAVQSPRSVRRQIWQYLTGWSQVQAPLNGNDLKALGYKPGREFRLMLDRLLAATLDGEVSDRTEAETFLAEHFPLG